MQPLYWPESRCGLNAGNGFDTHNGFIYTTSMRGFYREWGLNIRPVW